MTIAIGQMRVYAGMPQKNKKTMLEMIAAAKAEHADIILFPEFEKLKTEISSLKARISELL